MDDEFIYKTLPEVPKGFAQSLYRRISANAPLALRSGTDPARRHPRRMQAALILVGVLVLVAWSQIRLWIRYVPIGDLWVIEFSLTQSVNNARTMVAIPTPGQASPRLMMLDGTQVVVILRYSSEPPWPEWIPDGFSATEVPGPGYSYEESLGMWSNEAGETIRFFVVPRVGGARPYAPPGMYKEVRVSGQPAILVYGRLAPNPPGGPQSPRKWDDTLGLQLTWSMEDAIYTLETLGTYITEADLIRMAESMKTVTVPAPWRDPTR